MVFIIETANIANGKISEIKEEKFSFLGKTFTIRKLLPKDAYDDAIKLCRDYLDSEVLCLLLVLSNYLGICLEITNTNEMKTKIQEIKLSNFTWKKPNYLLENSTTDSLSREDLSRKKLSNQSLSLDKLDNLSNLDTVINNNNKPNRNQHQKNHHVFRTLQEIFEESTEIKGNLLFLELTKHCDQIISFEQLSGITNKLAGEIDGKSQEKFRELVKKRLVTDSNVALEIVYQAFQTSIGPVANLIYEDIISEFDLISTFNDCIILINKLAEEIEMVEYKKQFYQIIDEKLGNILFIDES